jgi:predicted transcriptional regulator
MKVIRLGVASQQQMRQRVLMIAKGQLQVHPRDPKIWFTSMRSLAQVLSDENRALFNVIRESKPISISDLAELTGRKQGNLSRTLKTMANYGIVKMQKHARALRPIVCADRYEICV